MTRLVLMKKYPQGRTASYLTEDDSIGLGDTCVVETNDGHGFAVVMAETCMEACSAEDIDHKMDEDGGPEKQSCAHHGVCEKLRKIKILRKANEEDLRRMKEMDRQVERAHAACLEKIAKHKLPMKLVDVEHAFDGNKLIFYFTSEGRVDFRELVKDLAAVFKTRIEMRQIGVRDETRMLGGIGCCGRVLCCNSFLDKFDPVNIKMAKIQRLPLNPTKISGLCGRLLCCVRYEYDHYREMRRKMPRDSTLVMTDQGKGKIIDMNILKQTVIVELEDARVVEMAVEKIKKG